MRFVTMRKTWLAVPAAACLAAAVLAGAAHQAYAALAAAPSSGTPVCGQPVLNSPWNYSGAAGAYASGTAGLPTFGSAGTDFPGATAGLVVAAGDNSAAAGNGSYQLDNTVIYFEPGTHTITSGMYTGTGTVYIGGFTSSAGPAILNGQGHAGLDGSNSRNANETWKYLTIENFGSDRDGTVLGNVNGAAFSSGNTYQYDTIGPNEYNSSGVPGQNNGGGFGISFYSNTTIDHSCLYQDSQGAFNGSSGYNNKITGNEISRNGLGEYPDDPGNPNSCGCSAGGKLLDNLNSDVTGNWVHDNYNTGIWADFDNSGLDISGNYVSANWGSGIAVEASYNTQVSDNTITGNGWPSDGAFPSTPYTCFGGVPCTEGLGPVTGGGGGNPYAAIELDNSGGNANLSSVAIPDDVHVQGCSSNCTVTSRFSGHLLVQGNVLTDNFGGVKAYTDTDRYPGNVDNDSACSVPLGVGPDGQQPNSTTYYQQTKNLQTATSDSSVSGSTVTSTAGTVTICDNYGGAQGDAGPGGAAQAPSAGMAVFNMDAGTFLGNVASVTSSKSFTLDRSPGNASNFRLYVSAYGGCSMADYYGGGPGVSSGSPSANYWDNCIWGARNTTVSGNTFSLASGTVANCTPANMCGFMGTQAFLAGVPQLMQVFQAGYRDRIGTASGGLGNVWSNNAYTWTGTGGNGAWQFENGSQVTTVTRAQWQDTYGQDAGSSFSGSPAPAPSPSPSPGPASSSPPPSPSPSQISTSPPTSGVSSGAAGPGPAGAKCASCSSLSWTQTVSGTHPALLAGVAVGGNSSQTVTVTDNGIPMTAETGRINSNNQSAGFLQVFGLAAPPAGTNTITVTLSASANELTAGSESFSGASQAAPFGAPVTAYGSSATPSVTIGSTSGDMIAGFAASGSDINSASGPATSRYIANQDWNTGAGNSAGATSAATGSPVTMAWSAVSDWWAAAAVQVLAG